MIEVIRWKEVIAWEQVISGEQVIPGEQVIINVVSNRTTLVSPSQLL